MSSGYVYLLGNLAMPNFYKIGMSADAPAERARQLSAASGVPYPFDVICHIKTEDAFRDEQHLHLFLGDFRFSAGREFFRFAPVQMGWVIGLYQHHPKAREFALGDWLAQARYAKDRPIENPWANADQDGMPEMSPYPPDYLEWGE